jgi:hypothetical protein
VQREGPELRRNFGEFPNVIAKEIHTWNSFPLQFSNGRHIHLAGIEIAEEQMNRFCGVLSMHECLNRFPGPRPPGVKLASAGVGDPFDPVDVWNLDDLVTSLRQSLDKVITPVAVGRNRIPFKTLKTAKKDTHELGGNDHATASELSQPYGRYKKVF